jgi:hypothetical protein
VNAIRSPSAGMRVASLRTTPIPEENTLSLPKLETPTAPLRVAAISSADSAAGAASERIPPDNRLDASSPGTISAGALSARWTICCQRGTWNMKSGSGGRGRSYRASSIRVPWEMSR